MLFVKTLQALFRDSHACAFLICCEQARGTRRAQSFSISNSSCKIYPTRSFEMPIVSAISRTFIRRSSNALSRTCSYSKFLLHALFHCRVHVSSWQLLNLHDLCLLFPKHWLWMLLRMLLTWWRSCGPITTRAKPRLSTHTSSGKYYDSVVEI